MSTSEQKAREIVNEFLIQPPVDCDRIDLTSMVSAIAKAIDDAVREERKAFACECIDEINEAFNREQPDSVISHVYMLGCYAEAIDKLLIPRPRKRDHS
jgi:hypothetical protein